MYQISNVVLRSKELAADMSHLFGHSIDTDKRTYITPPHILEAISGEYDENIMYVLKYFY